MLKLFSLKNKLNVCVINNASFNTSLNLEDMLLALLYNLTVNLAVVGGFSSGVLLGVVLNLYNFVNCNTCNQRRNFRRIFI